MAGTAYLRAMYDRFGYPGLFGAYNAGPARYADYLAGRTRLPGETIAYLGSVGAGAAPPPAAPSRPSMPPLFAVRYQVPTVPETAVQSTAQPSLFALRREDQ